FLHYFAGIPSVSSLYWENLAGVSAAAAFFNDESGATAHQIARDLGLTHLMVPEGREVVRLFHDLGGRGPDQDAQGRTLISRLATRSADPPAWIEVDFSLLPVARARRSYRGLALHAPLSIYRLQPEPAPAGKR